MKFFAKVYQFMNSFVPVIENKGTGLISYGANNRLPNDLLKWVLDAGAAKKACSKRATYIEGDGFVAPAANAFRVNDKQTGREFLAELATYVAYFKGGAIKVTRDGTGKIVGAEILPLQNIRRYMNGDFTYNATFSAINYIKSKEIIIKPFLGSAKPLTPDEFKSIAATGELYYFFKKTADNPNYPIPEYYAGIEDVRTCAEMQKLDLETVMNGFMSSGILSIVGDINDTDKDEHHKTEKDYMNEALELFTGARKGRDGLSGRNRLLVAYARTKEEVPVLQQLNIEAIITGSVLKKDAVERSVCRLFGINPALCGYTDTAILGNQQAMSNASEEAAKDVAPDQQLIAAAMKAIFPEIDWTISVYTPYKFVPDLILSKLTPNEQRALLGYPKIADPRADEINYSDPTKELTRVAPPGAPALPA